MLAYMLASKPCSEATNILYFFFSGLTLAVEVKLEFMLDRFGGSPKDCDFMRKYRESITVY